MMFGRWKAKQSDPLDTPILNWTQHDPYTHRHLLTSMLVMGRTGSGKSSSVGKKLARALLDDPKIALLILAAKPEDKPDWIELFKKTNRKLIVVEPGGKWKFNALQYEVEHGADTRSLTDLIRTVGESISKGESSKDGDNGAFFQQQADRQIYHGITIVRLATGTVTAPDLEEFIGGAATSPEHMALPEWQDGFTNRCLKAAFEKQKTAVQAHEEERARNYYLRELPTMADKTRSSILAEVMGILHVYCSGGVHSLLSTETTCSPDDMLERGISVLVNTPQSERGVEGRFINAAFKLATQRAVLRRHAGPDDFINVIWSDEYPQNILSSDDRYIETCRSHRGCCVCMVQSVHSIYSQMSGETGRHHAGGLISNFGLKVFMALGDSESAEFASSHVGRCLKTFIGGSSRPSGDLFNEFFGQSEFTGSFSEHLEKELEPNVFMNGLRTGGPLNHFLCDAYLIQSGEPFANGTNWLRCTFSQKG
jgi:hypothetical protein